MKLQTIIIQCTIFILFLLNAVESINNKCKKRKYLYEVPYYHKWPRIRAAEMAEQGQYPFYATIGENEYNILCGGSIITDLHILTAAHCLVTREEGKTVEKDPYQLHVILGSAHRSGINGQIGLVDKLFIHPGYEPSWTSYALYDIAIIKLYKPIKFNANVQPIILSEHLDKDKNLFAVGFRRFDNQTIHPILQHRDLPPIELANSIISPAPGSLCMSILPINSCFGDSGGPLIVISQKEKYIQIGIVTDGNEGNCASKYVDFQDVSYHRCWIQNVIDSL